MDTGDRSNKDLYVTLFHGFDIRLATTHHERDTKGLDTDFFKRFGFEESTIYKRYLQEFNGENFIFEKRKFDEETDLIFIATLQSYEDMKNERTRLLLSVVNQLVLDALIYSRDSVAPNGCSIENLNSTQQPTTAKLVLNAEGRLLSRSRRARKLLSRNDIGWVDEKIHLKDPLDQMWLNHTLAQNNGEVSLRSRRNLRSTEGELAGCLAVVHLDGREKTSSPFEQPRFIVTYESFLVPSASPPPLKINGNDIGSSAGQIAALIGKSAASKTILETMKIGKRRLSRAIEALNEEIGSEDIEELTRITSSI